jgi:hypothetical protein
MTNHSANPLPDGVRAIAALFALCGIYLAIAGGLMLVQCVKQIDIYKSPVSPVILCALCG